MRLPGKHTHPMIPGSSDSNAEAAGLSPTRVQNFSYRSLNLFVHKTHTHGHTCKHTHTHKYVQHSTHTHTHTHANVHTLTNAYNAVHTHRHTHTHTDTYVDFTTVQ